MRELTGFFTYHWLRALLNLGNGISSLTFFLALIMFKTEINMFSAGQFNEAGCYRYTVLWTCQ